MNVSGTYDRDEVGSLQGAVAASSVQFAANAIWRVGRVLALSAEFRAARYLEVHGRGNTTIELDDGRTTLDIFATADTGLEDKALSSFATHIHLSFQQINIRFGLVIGNYNLGGINLIVPVRLPIPELDLFVRF